MEDGFYWVKLKPEHINPYTPQWQIAYHIDSTSWYLTGLNMSISEDFFEEIDENRIVRGAIKPWDNKDIEDVIDDLNER